MRRWLWIAWWLCVALWTAALTTTAPVHIHQALLPEDPWGLPVSKILHVSAYAFLAAFAMGLRPPTLWRWLFVILLLEHGVATEWIQAFVPERGPSVNDIVIDHCGVALGVALTLPWWRPGTGV
jgi:hypothetical protein